MLKQAEYDQEDYTMIRPIVKDILFLSQKSEPATASDLQTAQDLRDTLAAHREECVGMAANMIGELKRMIIVSMGMMALVMLNPVILERRGEYEAEEGCLSLTGTRKTRRFQTIRVRFQDTEMKEHTQEFTGWTAEIIQHECDCLEGKII
jgi:peptide deformylase